MVQGISAAKWSYVTRRVVDRGQMCLSGFPRKPRLGDLVAAKVTALGAHAHMEDVHGRSVSLYPGDILVGAYGNRYATDFFEGYLPEGRAVHLLTAGGLIGTVVSAHTRRDPPTELEVIGALTDHRGAVLSVEDFAIPTPAAAVPGLGTLVVLGSSMNAGKTTTMAAMVRGWRRAGLTAGAGKITGSGSGKDRWMYIDAGATAVLDFLDFGLPSTFGYPLERLRATMFGVRDGLVDQGAQAVALEIADGLLQTETAALATCLAGFADGIVLAVADALGASAGSDILAALDVPIRAVSGRVTASPLASREAAAATGIPVLSPAQLAGGAAVDLLIPTPATLNAAYGDTDDGCDDEPAGGCRTQEPGL
ncbi:DUF1611 domain-containing protein [Streptomyces sp. NPDC005708]|uniref:DUF1611 domain-containing protein n=1 Tax=Streptomyces sp. NPDC005708 TaxID=3154564 RepID=UPI00340A63EC